MKKLLIILFVLAPIVILAQDDDPFATPGSDDPFADPAPPPQEQPQTQPPTQPAEDPFAEPAPADSDDPFASDDSTSGDPFAEGSVPGLPGGNKASGSILDNLSDTLTQPLRPEFPWKKRALEERQILEKYAIRESDVFWAKTVWREIDIREKINHPFAYPSAPFLTILLDVIRNNDDVKLYKYDPFSGIEFQDETTWAEVEEGLGQTTTVDVPRLLDDGTEVIEQQTVTNKFNIGSVTRFRIKEVWYFDKKHSRMKVDIMGIAPLRQINISDFGMVDPSLAGAASSQDVLFWIYYPDIRKHLARYETFNPLNDALRMSWDDLMERRIFASYIVKTSNPLDREISDYTQDQLDALYESEYQKEKIFNFEHDLWSY